MRCWTGTYPDWAEFSGHSTSPRFREEFDQAITKLVEREKRDWKHLTVLENCLVTVCKRGLGNPPKAIPSPAVLRHNCQQGVSRGEYLERAGGCLRSIGIGSLPHDANQSVLGDRAGCPTFLFSAWVNSSLRLILRCAAVALTAWKRASGNSTVVFIWVSVWEYGELSMNEHLETPATF